MPTPLFLGSLPRTSLRRTKKKEERGKGWDTWEREGPVLGKEEVQNNNKGEDRRKKRNKRKKRWSRGKVRKAKEDEE